MMKSGHSFEFNKFRIVKIPPEEPESRPSPIKHQQTDCKMKPASERVKDAYLKRLFELLAE
jgi:hypothetical protein